MFTSAYNSMIKVSRFVYSRAELFSLRRVPPDITLLGDISSVGLLRYQGRRAGRLIQLRSESWSNFQLQPKSPLISSIEHNIPVIINYARHSHPPRRKPVVHRNLTPVPRQRTEDGKHGKPASTNFRPNPNLYVINATSLEKPHAIQQLAADLTAYSIDLALISETWFKSHHSDDSQAIPGYNLLRRDRARRRGGGVAIYVKSDLPAQKHTPPNDDSKYEIIWIRLEFHGSTFFIGSLCHPPKPIYNTEELISHLHQTLERLDDEPGEPIIILAGDFNQIPHSSIEALGLQIEFSGPTHMGHPLDRIYSSIHVYDCCRTFQSAVRTGHMAIVASADVIDIPTNKTKTVCTFRRRTPAQHAAFPGPTQINRLEFSDLNR